jgi:uncharacterized membrane protein YphA (DoxX/SURF4 family)
MNTALWVVQVFLALAFLGSGSLKVVKSKAELAEAMPWVEDFSANTVRFIGVMEVLGGLGLVLPALTGIAPLLTPLAATGLAVTMLLAAATHVRRHEAVPFAVVNLALLAGAAFVAWGRFGPHPL